MPSTTDDPRGAFDSHGRTFGGPHDLQQERYTSQADALKGHKKAVALAKDASN